MKFGIYLVKSGRIDPTTLVKAIEIQLARRPLLGKLALETGHISTRDVFEILGEQADKQVPFGTIAVEITVRFKAPTHFGDTITAKATVAEKIEEKRRVRMDCEFTNQNGQLVAVGSALVIPPPKM